MRTIAAGTLVLCAVPAFAGDHVVLEGPSKDPGFRAAAARLAERRDAEILRFDPLAPEKLLPRLRALAPRYVTIVLPPEHVEFGFQRRFLDVATRLDDDPFPDFAFGYVTGATGKEALDLVEAGVRAEEHPRPVVLGRLGGSASKSLEFRSSKYRLHDREAPVVRAQVRGGDDEHDREFLASFLTKLSSCSVVHFAGHGFPDRVVGCADAADLAGLRLEGAYVLNVACWTGVVDRWYRTDRSGTLVAERVDPARSLALAMLRTGLCGYVAHLCPRPQGPEMDRELVAVVAAGLALGDARRREYDKAVLGFLGFGEESMTLDPPRPGEKRRRDLDAIRDVMLEDATGGVLFGDPALRPFETFSGGDPVAVTTEGTAAGLAVSVSCSRECLWLHCDEPAGRIGGKPAMKVYARLPLGDLHVADVTVDHARIGARDVEHRVIWAVEEDHGDRFVHVKVVFPRQDGRHVAKEEDLSIRFAVRAAADANGARARGGEVEPPIRTGR